MYLRRPVGEHYNQEYRLDRVLERKANEGVKIYAIVYNEPTIALTMNSEYTQKHLNALHPNIIVLRHPNYILPLLWSHHEKIIVVDQLVAYVGGLDLCYGRMDTNAHELFDDPV
jgi:phospholipase D1/2